MTFTRILLLYTLTFYSGILRGQAQSLPVNLSIFNEATAIPFTIMPTNPVHPGIQVGTEWEGNIKNYWRFYPSVSLGYLLHQKLFQGLFLNADVGIDFQTSWGVNLKSKIGLGYLHTFSTQQEYQFTGQGFESKPDRGNARIMPSITLGLGYRLDKASPRSAEIYFLYQSWVEYPYSPGFIPLMTHVNLHLGTRFYPFKSE